MNNENLNPVEKLRPFTKVVMSIGTLPSSFYSSMTYYESMVWLYEYMKNTVIPTINNNAESIEELQALYIQLKEYIDHYFDNLDVQEEINNKLDEMVLDGSFNEVLKTLTKYPLYNAGINATVTAYSNVINSPVPVLSDNILTVIDYNDFDNVINEIVAYTDYDDISYKGYYSTIGTITSTSVIFNEELPDNYVKENMWIILTNGLPTKLNWKYLGKITSYEGNRINVEKWVSYETKEEELPENVDYAWLNPLTKLYGQNFSLHNDSNNLKGLIGSQCDIYGNGNENYIVGYSPVLRTGTGDSGLRIRTIGESSWDKGISLEGNFTKLLSVNNNVLINGDESLDLLKLGISSSEVNTRKPLWAINENTSLADFNATVGATYYVYNASDNPIILTGTFRGFGSENITTIEIPARQIIQIFAVTEKIYLLISSYYTSYHVKIQNDKYNSNMVAITQNTNITNTIYPYIVTNGKALYNFILGGNDATLSLTTGTIYLNGTNSGTSATLKARTSGTLYINKENNTVYINSNQPS